MWLLWLDPGDWSVMSDTGAVYKARAVLSRSTALTMTSYKNGKGAQSFRDLLRSLPTLVGKPPAPLNVAEVPAHPADLFKAWLNTAIEHGIPEPHAMTLSTCDKDNRPDARVLILKDLDEVGWWFATSSASAKGQQLADHASGALTFYWPALGRQVRVRGNVVRAPAAASAADFLGRTVGARATALASRTSAPLGGREECVVAVQIARAQLEKDPALISQTWALYAVAPDYVEFWQANSERLHERIVYEHRGTSWTHHLLWP
ncbi:Pyridoxine/pyridoxamine 5'-phosphate oxidase [Powellomyces hirtus]|nr:Pyridoxine/pyridoxamine 5'-phosphate oxidase [Powellomyces hirtus]